MRALIIICLAVLVAAPASARNVWVTGNVLKTVVSEDAKFAGCLVKIDTPYQGQVPVCRNDWLSFDCAGLFTENPRVLAGSTLPSLRARWVFLLERVLIPSVRLMAGVLLTEWKFSSPLLGNRVKQGSA